MKIRIIFGTVIVSVVIALGLFFHVKRDVRPRIGYTWTQGAEQQYQLTITTDVRLALPGLETPRTLLQKIAGTLNMKVFDTEEGQILVGFQLVQPAYTLNAQSDEALQKALAAPFVVTFDPSGRPLSFHFPETLLETERIILEESIRTFQVVLPRENRTDWTVTENHATGSYLAQYQVREDDSIQKTKTRYTDLVLSAGDKEPAEARIHKSSAVSRISPDIAWIKTAVVHETLAISSEAGLSTQPGTG